MFSIDQSMIKIRHFLNTDIMEMLKFEYQNNSPPTLEYFLSLNLEHDLFFFDYLSLNVLYIYIFVQGLLYSSCFLRMF